jgi:hypothetical protein
VDLAYRDYAVADPIELSREGVDVEPMKVLLRENRMISSITAELDQKSGWEIFTDLCSASSISAPKSGPCSTATYRGRGL